MTNEEKNQIESVLGSMLTIFYYTDAPSNPYRKEQFEKCVHNTCVLVDKLTSEDTLNEKRKKQVRPLPDIAHTNEQNDKYLDTVFQIEGIIKQILSLPYGSFFSDKKIVVSGLLKFKETLDYNRLTNNGQSI